jgi:hypothetical protein
MSAGRKAHAKQLREQKDIAYYLEHKEKMNEQAEQETLATQPIRTQAD